jgi:hypothetical protein
LASGDLRLEKWFVTFGGKSRNAKNAMMPTTSAKIADRFGIFILPRSRGMDAMPRKKVYGGDAFADHGESLRWQFVALQSTLHKLWSLSFGLRVWES